MITNPRAEPDLARSTATMTVLTLLSRLTGFVRNVVVVGVLGVTFLGNTYETANTVPNLLFELIAAGVLQAVLIPTLVELMAAGEDDEAEHVARSVLGLAAAALAVLAGIGFLLAPFVMRLLMSNVDDPQVRADEVRLGTILLWFFLPQVVLYASNTVATGVLNAKSHFSVPVIAPLLNNVVVVASYGVFAWMRHGARPSLDLTGGEIAVLGLGTTLGVIAFCGAPVIAAVRSGTSLRPRFDWRHPAVRRIARLGGWAAAFLAATQILLVVVLVLANDVQGGVVAWNLGFTIFVLPHALVALPVLTALFPTMARQAATGDEVAYQRTLSSGVRAIAYLVLPASAAMLALSVPMARILQFGKFHPGAIGAVAAAVAAFGPGLVGYGTFLFLARALYARGDTRTPALVNLGVVVGASVAMVVAFPFAHGHARIAVLAGAHSGGYLVGSAVLFLVLRSRSSATGGTGDLGRSLLASVTAAAVAGASMWAIGEAIGAPGRIHSLLELVVAGAAGLVVYVAAAALLGGPRPRTVPALLRGQHG
ncbi:MAG: putative rane protein putative virulence factor [Actinomycetia bacterium]|nr:putative rane protein putative virulence factor [Actinomycetes bacterium]